ncbi:MAG: hypothetical protein INQ03_17595 [Candidatus Heimdallarchaeota archaeon]|nr:hypothetical protein [Candidatus Heimdallarchaeota archaeon]
MSASFWAEYVYMIFFILGGLVGVIMGFNRLIKKEEEESDRWKIFAGVAGLLVFLSVMLMHLTAPDGVRITNYSSLFGILFFMSIIARPLKKIPVAFVLAIIVGMILTYFVFSRMDDSTVLGSIDMKWIAVALGAVVLIVFVIGRLQEGLFDGMLVVLGWSPLIIIISLALIGQGIALLAGYMYPDGIFDVLPG